MPQTYVYKGKKCQKCGKVPTGLDRIHRVVIKPNRRLYRRIMYLCTECREEVLGE